LPFGQVLEFLLDPRQRLASLQDAIGCVLVPTIWWVPPHPRTHEAARVNRMSIIVAIASQRGERQRTSIALSSGDTAVDENPEDPGLQRSPALETWETLEHADPCVLHHLLGLSRGRQE